ncbi:hypothetical protein M2102_000512 [Fusobacterium sp. PH5-7]|uniref:gp53-like domain-containing protein n=1 Tax=Fusobacterium sp. PH5-7 TaxID=2940528 RepID=UPI002475C76B|nr:hypothetical protein [Fusobacterium sp. PH5-7]MDH6456897.1 hypothetical protein [Fusobacterium sp. PH5-7]
MTGLVIQLGKTNTLYDRSETIILPVVYKIPIIALSNPLSTAPTAGNVTSYTKLNVNSIVVTADSAGDGATMAIQWIAIGIV